MKRFVHPIALRLAALLAIMLAATNAARAYSQAPAPATSPPEIPKVTVVSPAQKDVKQSIKLPGNLVPDEQVSLYSKVAGYLDEIAVDKGDTVAKDQVIAKISVPEMGPELALAEAKARAAQSRSGKARAAAELDATTSKRLIKLRDAEPGAVTQEDVDVATAKDKIARSEIENADSETGVAGAEVKRLKTLMEYLVVRAPFDGTITQRFADPGAFIAAGSGTKPIVELTRTKKLRLAFDLPERLVPFVKTGTTIAFGVSALPGKPFTGPIARRTDTIAADTRTMRAEVDVDNSDGSLAPGMYAAVQIPVGSLKGLSVIPASAIRTIDGKVCVLAVENDVLRKIPVESLMDSGTEVVVSGPLSADMKIVSQGPTTLTDGQRVEAKPAQ